MQDRAGGRNEEGRRDLMTIEHRENARQALDGAVLALRERDRQRSLPGQEFVVDVERQRDRHLRGVRPGLWRQLAAGPHSAKALPDFVLVGIDADSALRYRRRGATLEARGRLKH